MKRDIKNKQDYRNTNTNTNIKKITLMKRKLYLIKPLLNITVLYVKSFS